MDNPMPFLPPKTTQILFSTCLFWLCINFGLSAQNLTPPFPEDETWKAIEEQLEQQESDTALFFVISLIREKCGDSFECLNKNYLATSWHFERQSNYFGGIYVSYELAKVCKKWGELDHEARAVFNSFRYYNVLGNLKLAAIHLEKALKIYEASGNQVGYRKLKRIRLEINFQTNGSKELLEEMEALYQEYISSGDIKSSVTFLIRMIGHAKLVLEYDKMHTYINTVEQALFVDSVKVTGHEYLLFYTNKAEYANIVKDYETASFYYQKALEANETFESKWSEVDIFISMAGMEYKQGRLIRAKKHLDKALSIANTFEPQDLLKRIYQLRSEIAEEEGRYFSALQDMKKEQSYYTNFKKKGEGFSSENYFLTQEKEKLATEKENSELQLQLKNSQLRNSIITIALVLFLAAALTLAFFNLRKSKKELSVQNELITEQAARLRTLDAAKSRFFANVSHELRTPISLIRGPIKTLLKRKELKNEEVELLQMANQGSQNLQLLVNEILDLGKMESGKMELVKSPVQLSTYFSQYFSQFESLGYQKGIAYDYETFIPKKTTALLDKEKCRQLVFNLLSNAFKFTPPSGSIKVVLKMENSQLHLTVSDTGKGIHPTDLPHVFDRYFQTNRPDAPATGGTGIGLALCQQYAQLFGGEISVESTLGKGTVFKVMFPVEITKDLLPEEDLSNELAYGFKHVKERPDQLPIHTEQATRSEKPSVLVVEDNADLRAYIQLVLKDHYQIALAENGQTALDHIAANGHPDLILSDLMMPVMDGYQFLEKLKDDPSTQQIPAIMLTARAEKDDRLKALRIGVDDYMTKPFDEEELLVRIGNLLSNQSVRRKGAIEEELLVGKATDGHSEMDREWLGSFELYVRQHLSNSQLSVIQLADEFAMSKSTLLRQLKRLTGLAPQKYLSEIRLDAARQLLAEQRFRSVARVAQEVGYNDVRGFSKIFIKRYGKRPSEIATY